MEISYRNVAGDNISRDNIGSMEEKTHDRQDEHDDRRGLRPFEKLQYTDNCGGEIEGKGELEEHHFHQKQPS